MGYNKVTESVDVHIIEVKLIIFKYMNSQATSLSEAFASSLSDLWYGLVGIIPDIIGAIILLIIGLILAKLLSKLTRWAIKKIKVDLLFEKTKITKKFEDIGFHFVPSDVLAWIVKWFIIIATFMAVADTLRLQEVTNFLREIVLYIPNVIVAILILVIGLIVGDLAKNFIKKTLQASKLNGKRADTLGRLGKYAVLIFAGMAALIQLGIAAELVQILFAGIVITAALAFGLGGKDQAKRWLESLFSN